MGLRLDTNLNADQLKGLSVDKIKEELEKEASVISDAIDVNPKCKRKNYIICLLNNLYTIYTHCHS